LEIHRPSTDIEQLGLALHVQWLATVNHLPVLSDHASRAAQQLRLPLNNTKEYRQEVQFGIKQV